MTTGGDKLYVSTQLSTLLMSHLSTANTFDLSPTRGEEKKRKRKEKKGNLNGMLLF